MAGNSKNYFSKDLTTDFNTTLVNITEVLQAEGFVNLTETDSDDKIGSMLTCNIIVQETKTGTQVSVVVALMQAVSNLEPEGITMKGKLQKVIEIL